MCVKECSGAFLGLGSCWSIDARNQEALLEIFSICTTIPNSVEPVEPVEDIVLIEEMYFVRDKLSLAPCTTLATISIGPGTLITGKQWLISGNVG